MQAAMENIHMNQYQNLIDLYIPDRKEVEKILQETCIQRKSDWILRYSDPSNATIVERLIAFLMIEGVFFSSSFAVIFWMRAHRHLDTLAAANDLIFRDENLHWDFIAEMYIEVVPAEQRLTQSQVSVMVDDVVDIEMGFFNSAMPAPMENMSSLMMEEHIKHRANMIIAKLGYAPVYPTVIEEPFAFMRNMSYSTQGNVHERRASEYALTSVNLTSRKKLRQRENLYKP